MVNPYRQHADRLSAVVKEVSKNHLHTTAFENRFSDSSVYSNNFVVVSGGQPFDEELQERVDEMMKEVTDVAGTETM